MDRQHEVSPKGRPRDSERSVEQTPAHRPKRGNPLWSALATHGPPAVQAKLEVGAPDDEYERQADRVADQVMRPPEPPIQRPPEEEEPEELRRKPLAEPITSLLQREAEPEEEEEIGSVVQTKGEGRGDQGLRPNVASTIEALRGRGGPLLASSRAYFEPRFGRDFGAVQVHTGGQAGAAAKAVKAKAFTVGNDVAFGPGQYAPETQEGKRLMAHELAHVVQQRGPMVVQRAPLQEELAEELQTWAKRAGTRIDPKRRDYAFTLQEYAWSLICDPATQEPIRRPKKQKALEVWKKKFQKAQLLVGMILAGGAHVEQKEDRAAMILNLMGRAGFSSESAELTKKMADPTQIAYVYAGILDRVQGVKPELLTTITQFFLTEKGTTGNPVVDKLRDSSGSFAKSLGNTQLTAILRLLIRSYETDPMMIDLLARVLVHKPGYRKTFSDWMWQQGKGSFLFQILESDYFIEPDYGPTVLPAAGELKLHKDMPWVYANKQRYYLDYLVQLGRDTGVDIKRPQGKGFGAIRQWLDSHTEKIGQALAKKYPGDPARWIKVYEQLADIFFYHVEHRNVKPDLSGKLGKLEPAAPKGMRLKADCDVLATYAMRYIAGVQDPDNPAMSPFEPIGYMVLVPSHGDGHALALIRRAGKYYVISNKEILPTTVTESTQNAEKEQAIKAMRKEALEVYDPQPTQYKVYYADALARGAMPGPLANTSESTRRTDLEP